MDSTKAAESKRSTCFFEGVEKGTAEEGKEKEVIGHHREGRK